MTNPLVISAFRACPSCGSKDVEVESWSAEYRGGTYYRCHNCDYEYHKGSGMGTGSGTEGKHPRRFSSSKGKLVEVGEWCGDCKVVDLPGQCDCPKDGEEAVCASCVKWSEYDERDLHKVVHHVSREHNCDWCRGDGVAYLVGRNS